MDNCTVIVGDFSIPLSTMDKLYRQESYKETLELNYTVNQ